MTLRHLGLPVALAALLGLANVTAQEKGKTAAKKTPTKATKPGEIAGYAKKKVLGFQLIINNTVIENNTSSELAIKPLDVLEGELKDIGTVMPRKMLDALHAVPIWVEWDDGEANENGGRVLAVYYSGSAMAMARAERDPRKAGNVEIVTLKYIAELKQPGGRRGKKMPPPDADSSTSSSSGNTPAKPPTTDFDQIVILHELMHVIHDKVISYNNPDIKAAYSAAMDAGLYDKVDHARGGPKRQAYAATNDREYFAEIGCAYLDRCSFYPFTYDELKTHDERAYKLMEKFWGKHDTIARKVKPADPKAAALRLEQEKLARPKLEKARAMLRESGKKVDALKLLQEVVTEYPKTEAAGEAQRLIDAQPKS